jgi:hypothetical protein
MRNSTSIHIDPFTNESTLKIRNLSQDEEDDPQYGPDFLFSVRSSMPKVSNLSSEHPAIKEVHESDSDEEGEHHKEKID